MLLKTSFVDKTTELSTWEKSLSTKEPLILEIAIKIAINEVEPAEFKSAAKVESMLEIIVAAIGRVQVRCRGNRGMSLNRH